MVAGAMKEPFQCHALSNLMACMQGQIQKFSVGDDWVGEVEKQSPGRSGWQSSPKAEFFEYLTVSFACNFAHLHAEYSKI